MRPFIKQLFDGVSMDSTAARLPNEWFVGYPHHNI
jgi:hypothetical protein